ncbi:Cof-type HAD-IIB family hydrolase [Halobacillus sp. H74]|uniref:Cof-type HAD-IIB family hydrolase n=1 Tax=Halobacillus sp. H74 TaxID=3457436 RepID=UPI003FCE2BEE
MDLIAIDLDGTLLNSKNQISEENIKAIQYAKDRDVEVVIATGRAEFDVRQIFADLPVDTWVIGANGATIHQPDGSLFDAVPIEEKDAEKILKWLEAKEFYYEVFSDSSILTPQNGHELLQIELDRIRSANPHSDIERLEAALEKQFSQTGFFSIDSYKDIIEAHHPVYNVLAFSFDEEKLQEGWEQFQSSQNLTIVSSADHNFELEHRSASKGSALQKLAGYLDIPIENTAAIGDSPNDLSMISIAGQTAAMGNAKESVLKASDSITRTNDQNGVAYKIYQWLN